MPNDPEVKELHNLDWAQNSPLTWAIASTQMHPNFWQDCMPTIEQGAEAVERMARAFQPILDAFTRSMERLVSSVTVAADAVDGIGSTWFVNSFPVQYMTSTTGLSWTIDAGPIAPAPILDWREDGLLETLLRGHNDTFVERHSRQLTDDDMRFWAEKFPDEARRVKEDLRQTIALVPTEDSPRRFRDQLIGRLRLGRIDGRSYDGTDGHGSRCIKGHLLVYFEQIGNTRTQVPQEYRESPIEQFAYLLRPGDTPQNSAVARWLLAALQELDFPQAATPSAWAEVATLYDAQVRRFVAAHPFRLNFN